MSIFGHTKDVANEVVSLVKQGQCLPWTTFTNGTDLTVYATADDQIEVPAFKNIEKACCFDIYLLALFQKGWIDRAGLSAIYLQILPDGMSALCAKGIGTGLSAYNVNTGPHEIAKGHLVFFGKLNHVALATGNTANHFNQTGAEVVSFWTDSAGNPPGTQPGLVVPDTPIQFDTVERLCSIMPEGTQVQTCKPTWR